MRAGALRQTIKLLWPKNQLHNHSNNVSDWFENVYLIRFGQSAGSSQVAKGMCSMSKR